MKPIEERVKKIVDESPLLRLQEKADIICLIECYKGADKLAQELYKQNETLKEELNMYKSAYAEMETGDYYD